MYIILDHMFTTSSKAVTERCTRKTILAKLHPPLQPDYFRLLGCIREPNKVFLCARSHELCPLYASLSRFAIGWSSYMGSMKVRRLCFSQIRGPLHELIRWPGPWAEDQRVEVSWRNRWNGMEIEFNGIFGNHWPFMPETFYTFHWLKTMRWYMISQKPTNGRQCPTPKKDGWIKSKWICSGPSCYYYTSSCKSILQASHNAPSLLREGNTTSSLKLHYASNPYKVKSLWFHQLFYQAIQSMTFCTLQKELEALWRVCSR